MMRVSIFREPTRLANDIALSRGSVRQESVGERAAARLTNTTASNAALERATATAQTQTTPAATRTAAELAAAARRRARRSARHFRGHLRHQAGQCGRVADARRARPARRRVQGHGERLSPHVHRLCVCIMLLFFPRFFICLFYFSYAFIFLFIIFRYFCQNEAFGAAAFESLRIDDSKERNVRMKSVGMLATSHELLKKCTPFLRNQVRYIYIQIFI